MYTKCSAILCAVATMITAPSLTYAQSRPAVTVVNTKANPVPVTGSVTVGNSVVPVEVSNADPIPVVVQEESARTPYSVDVAGPPDCSNLNCFLSFPPVPAGKMLVIQHLSTYVRPSNSATIFDFVELTANNTEEDTGTRFIFPMTRIGLAGGSVVFDTWGVNASLLAFVQAGQYARLTFATRNGGANSVAFRQGTISGYLIDAP